MLFSIGDIKKGSRRRIKEYSRPIFWTTFAYFAISVVFSLLISRISGLSEMMNAMNRAILSGVTDYEELMQYIPQPSAVATVLVLAFELMTLVIEAGYAGFCLKVSRGANPVFRDLFSSFDNFFKFLWLVILRTVFVLLWSLLFVIPGIIASYRYSQAIYILHDNPDMSAMDCLRESSRLMAGHKLEFFILELSFIGWQFLGAFIALFIGVDILSLWLTPYLTISTAIYFTMIAGYRPRDNGAPPVWEQ